MCGGGRGGGGNPKPEKKAANPASAPVAATPAVAQSTAETDASTTPSAGARRRRFGKRGLRVGLDVSVANVGGSGKSGLNIPQSD